MHMLVCVWYGGDENWLELGLRELILVKSEFEVNWFMFG